MGEQAIDNELRLIGQGYIGEQEAQELGGIFGRGRPDPGTEEAAIMDTTRQLLKRRRRIPQEIRALMGEVTNPGEAAAVTTARLSSVLESNRFWQKMAILNAMPGQRLFSPIPVPKGRIKRRGPHLVCRERGSHS